MAAAWLWARSEWRRRPGALVALAGLIAIAGAVTIAAAAGARRADTAFDRFVERTGEPEITAESFDSSAAWEPGRLDSGAEAFQQAMEVPGVVGAQSLAAFGVAVGDNPDAFAYAMLEVAGDQRPLLVDGRRFDPADPAEVMLNESAAEVYGLGAGDQIELHSVGWDRRDEYLTQQGAFVPKDGPAFTATVVGVQRTATDLAQQLDPFVMLTPAFAEQYADEIVHCSCLVVIDAERARTDQVIDDLTALYGPLGYTVGLEDQGELPANIAKGIGVEVATLWLLGLAAGLAGVVIVGQAMARHADEAADERSTGAALGATTRQLTIAGVLTLAPAVLLGAVGAVLLAIALSPLTPRGLARLVEVDRGLWTDEVVLVIGVLLILATGAVLVAATARRTATRSARRPARLATLPNALGPAGMLGVGFALRPGRRGRTAATAALVAMATGIGGIIGVWAFEAGRGELVREGRLYGVDAELAWRGTDDQLPAVIATATATPGVEALGLWRTIPLGGIEMSTAAGSATGIAGALEPLEGWSGSTLVAGRRPEGANETALGKQLVQDLGVELGDRIEVTGPGGAGTLTVVGEVVLWDTDEVDHGVELTPQGLTRLAGAICAPDDPCAPHVDYLLARTTDDATGQRAREQLEGHSFARIPLPSEVDNLEQAGALPWALAGFLALLGLAGVLHAIVTVAHRRQRDVVIARALGLSCGGARAAVRWSAATMGLIGLLVGLPLGIVVGQLVWAATARGLGAVVEQAIPWWAPLTAAAGAMAITLVLAELPARRTARARPAVELRAE